MTPEEIKAAQEALLAKAKEQVAEQLKNVADKSAVEELKNQLAALEEKAKENNYKALQADYEKLALKVNAMSEAPREEKGFATIGEALKAAFEAKKEEIANAVSGKQSAPIRLTVKQVGAISIESSIGNGSTQVSITQNTGIISPIRTRELTYLANVSVGSIGTNRAMWIEETDEEGTPIMLGEGDAKTQLDVQYVEQTMAVKKIAVYCKVTTELMADIPQLISVIQNNLAKRMDIKLEENLFSGSGVGDNLKGLITYATAFALNGAGVANANELDVIEKVALQCKVAHGIPNAIFVNPTTVSDIKLIKDSTGRPVWKDYVTINGDLVISGMKVIESKAITAGDFVGGDLSVVNVLNREGFSIQIGLDGNDFTQNKKTMLMERRLVQFVSANDTAVIITGSFDDAITAIAGVTP